MKKVLIITYYWPPAGGSGVQRWLKFVKYFRDFGIEPIIYTVKNPNYGIEDSSLENEIPNNIEVLKQTIWEPNNIFSLFKKDYKETSGFLNKNPSLFGKIAQYIRANFFIPDSRKFWIKPSVKFLKKYVSKNNIDTIITTGPPHSMHLIGLNLKQQLNIKWIADFRDPWVEIDYFHHLPLTKNAKYKHRVLEREVISNANAVLVVGKTMKKKFKKWNNNVYVITNGFDDEENKQEYELDTKFSITHIGLMNADRNPTILWEILSELVEENKEFKNDFQLNLIGKIDESVKSSILKFRLNKNVNLIDYVPHNEVINYQKKSIVLLLIINNVPNSKGIITGKIFEYLMANRPILAIAPTDGDLAEIIKNTDAGFVIDFDDKAKLKKNILELYKKFKQGNLIVKNKNISQYHRRELTNNVAEVIKSLNS